MSLANFQVDKLDGSVNQNLSRAVEKYSKQLVEELVDEGFDFDDVLEYLDDFIFDSVIANIEMEYLEKQKEIIKLSEKSKAVKEIIKIAEEHGLNIEIGFE